jgi:aryl-alcohol dehydrogenase-like predicted oxidoreductase
MRSCENSLRRLQTDYLDLYQLHNPPVDKLWSGGAPDALEKLKTEGKIRHYGVSISHPNEGVQIIRRNFGSALQVLFNVLNQRPSRELFAFAREANYGIIARVPLASALLAGNIQSRNFHPQDNRNNFLTQRRWDELFPKIERYLELCAQYRLSPVSAALQFVLSHQAVGVTIPGAKTARQVSENASASRVLLPAPLLQSLRAEFESYNFYLRYGIKV